MRPARLYGFPLLLSIVFAVAGLWPRPARAQFSLYTEPGSLAGKPEDRRTELERAVEEARWTLGPLRLHPWIGLRNVAYVDNVFSSSAGTEESDITASAGLGLRAYVPLGEKAMLTLHALPEYVWWADLKERRRLDGRYGAGLFGFFNRLTLELTGDTAETQQIVTPEFLQYTHARENTAELRVVLEAYRSLFVFAGAAARQYAHLLDEEPLPGVPQLQDLDRDEEVLRGGLRLRLGDRFQLGAGVEDSEVTFGDPTADLSNAGTSPIAELLYEGTAVYGLVSVASRDLEPEGPTSQFVPFDDVTGTAQLLFNAEGRVPVAFYGSRNLVYSLSAQHAYFLDELVGVSLGFRLHRKIGLRAYAEDGEHAYTPLAGQNLERLDDVSTLGANLTFELGWGTALSLQASDTEYDSNLDGFDRKVAAIGLTFDLGDVSWP